MSLFILGVDGDTTPKDDYARAVEAEFQALKALADKVGWPADVTPGIKAADAAWQSAKAKANVAKASVVRDVGPDSDLRRQIRDLTAKLQERLNVSQNWLSQHTIIKSIPNIATVAGSVTLTAVLAAILRSLLRKS